MGDGSVRFLKETINLDAYRAMSTVGNGEIIAPTRIERPPDPLTRTHDMIRVPKAVAAVTAFDISLCLLGATRIRAGLPPRPSRRSLPNKARRLCHRPSVRPSPKKGRPD